MHCKQNDVEEKTKNSFKGKEDCIPENKKRIPVVNTAAFTRRVRRLGAKHPGRRAHGSHCCLAGHCSRAGYSLKGFECQIAIKRKNLQDLLSSLGVDRKRFMDEVQRLKTQFDVGNDKVIQ
ncbi:MAG: hypothetical protein HYV59_09635 [Planctomycetes bacterium]|nr:hypothetical protein [Planctomycetota bacterium]